MENETILDIFSNTVFYVLLPIFLAFFKEQYFILLINSVLLL